MVDSNCSCRLLTLEVERKKIISQGYFQPDAIYRTHLSHAAKDHNSGLGPRVQGEPEGRQLPYELVKNARQKI